MRDADRDPLVDPEAGAELPRPECERQRDERHHARRREIPAIEMAAIEQDARACGHADGCHDSAGDGSSDTTVRRSPSE